MINSRGRLIEIAKEAIRYTLAHSWIIGLWILLVAVSVGIFIWDLRRNNQKFTTMTGIVWLRIVLSLGPVGLALYWYVGKDLSFQ
jgi:ABC-type molybdate transport system permease subunit